MERKEMQGLVGKAIAAVLSSVADTPDHRRRAARAIMRCAVRIVLGSGAPPPVAVAVFVQALRDEAGSAEPSEAPFVGAQGAHDALAN
jgi:hypothetical protein